VNELILTLLLAAHLLCVNVAAGGPIVAAWLDWRGAARGDSVAAKAAVALARASLLGLIAGAALGLCIGWLKWDADYRPLWLGPLSYKLKWAIVEAVFSLVLMVGWWMWLPIQAGAKRWAMVVRGVLAVLAATNLLYHFPVLFAVAARLADRGETSGEPIGPSEFRHLMIAGQTPALAVHVVLASLAVASMLLIVFALRKLRRGEDGEATKLARWGSRWALVPSLLQLPVGLWTLVGLPADAQSRLMGDSMMGTVLFVAALAAALWLLHELVQVSMGETTRLALVRAIAAMLLTVILMTAMQAQTRVALGQALVPVRRAFLPAANFIQISQRQAGMPAPLQP
jgi:hypothetical protein